MNIDKLPWLLPKSYFKTKKQGIYDGVPFCLVSMQDPQVVAILFLSAGKDLARFGTYWCQLAIS
jgi:hypothetical protein